MISSRQNSRLKDIRRLLRCKGDRTLLEGPNLVREALAFGNTIETPLMTQEFLESVEGQQIAARLESSPLIVEPRLLSELTDSTSPQGVVAVGHLPRGGIEDLPLTSGGIYLYLDGIQDPGNLGALARLAEASGAVAGLSSPGTVHPNHPRCLRASAGSLLRIPWFHGVEMNSAERRLSQINAAWVQLTAHGGHNLYDFDPPKTLVLVVGSEAHGVSEEVAQKCRRGIKIPIAAPVESLNAATAVAIVLFELNRRRMLGG